MATQLSPAHATLVEQALERTLDFLCPEAERVLAARGLERGKGR